MASPTPLLLLLLLLPFLLLHHAASQQLYFNNKQFDCYNNKTLTNTLGYTCNGPSSCTSFFTFRTTPTYSSLPSIAYLLSLPASSIASANNVTDVSTLPLNHLLLVPLPCSCTSLPRYYQHNATYNIKTLGETYQTIANNTYEGLTTCQALIAQNAIDSHNITVGDVVHAPLMCACPSTNQTKKGYNYIVSYLVASGDTLSVIADLFGVDVQVILDANELTATSIIYPFNPILVPFKKSPININLNPSSQSAPSPSPPSSPPPPPPSSASKKWVFVGIGIGAAVVALPILFLFVFLVCRRKRGHQEVEEALPPPRKAPVKESDQYKALPGDTTTNTNTNSNSWSISSEGVKYAIESLTVYKFESVQKATNDFSESNRISGSVFRGEFHGDSAAVKVLNGDVSVEINILKQINHSNIIRLSGFCAHDGNTYLIYEFAEHGSLRDFLVSTKNPISWKQRVGAAYGIAEGLNYLHNYCNPPYVHKNLSSSNVVLDAGFRAKITNFGLARTVEENEKLHLTKHVVGTKGYLAPEYIENGLVTPKMDVYAFGMVVLELLSGRIAGVRASSGEEVLSADSVREVVGGENVREKLRRFMDGGLRNRYPSDLAYSMAVLAKECVANDLNSRPSISDVLGMLSKIHSSSLDWDPSDELDRSSSLTQGR